MLKEFFGIRLSHFHLHEQKIFEPLRLQIFLFSVIPSEKVNLLIDFDPAKICIWNPEIPFYTVPKMFSVICREWQTKTSLDNAGMKGFYNQQKCLSKANNGSIRRESG